MQFTCHNSETTTLCDFPWLEEIDAGNGNNIYVNSIWSAPDFFFIFFLCILTVFIIARGIFFLFFIPVNKKG